MHCEFNVVFVSEGVIVLAGIAIGDDEYTSIIITIIVSDIFLDVTVVIFFDVD